ncbi:ABC transporter ATP-binding protein [Collinsella intestinalis]|uniref:ABC transporter ATP-binding protein n=1 Tax=Collinsella intestinalis TaxID=147207 RepID=UPI001956FA76|nr:ABC transporter ATP-binding protein [Collinsella intestinalis]MBM6682903.1 ABC transporter ATP-binding protein [Collinsella intestinalis]
MPLSHTPAHAAPSQTSSPARATSGKLPQTPASGGAVPVLEVRHIEKVYGSRQNVTRALNDVSFAVNQGEFVGIMGASGSGKSTLLNCVSTIDAVTSGEVLVGGVDVTRMKTAKLTRFRREQLGFIFQDSNLLDTLTARENIALPLTISRVPAKEVLRRVDEVAGRLGICENLDKYPYQMSGGQQQRVAAARALVTDPTIIMADEPTGALDSKNARLLLESFEAMNERLSATVLMVTHDSFAASYTHRVLFIRDGRIFTELRRGAASRQEFFERIMQVVAMMGGEGSDAL